MNFIDWLKKNKNSMVMFAGMVFPVFVLLTYPKYYQPDDIDAFLHWSKAWALGWRDIYINCPGCNYPFLGMFFSGGMVHFLGIINYDQMISGFRYYLTAIDLLNVVAVYFLLKKLGNSNPAFWAGLIGLLPSSFIGTSYWGQVDGLGQLIMMVIFIWVAFYNLHTKQRPFSFRVYVIVLGLLLSCVLLTKQLVMFSMISLGLLVSVNILLNSNKWMDVFTDAFLFLLAFFLPILFVDLTVSLDPPYISHLQYILATGSSHGDVISSYGFNVWSLFVQDPLVSSHEPLKLFTSSVVEFGIVPFSTGIGLFLFVNVFLFVLMLVYFRRKYLAGQRRFGVEDLIFWLLHLGLVNLAFNLFLSGTHERYLYHFYPFVISAFLTMSFINKRSLIILLAGAVFYGCFLFGYLSALNQIFGRLMFNGMAVFHLLLFAFIVRIFLQHVFFINQNSPAVPG